MFEVSFGAGTVRFLGKHWIWTLSVAVVIAVIMYFIFRPREKATFGKPVPIKTGQGKCAKILDGAYSVKACAMTSQANFSARRPPMEQGWVQSSVVVNGSEYFSNPNAGCMFFGFKDKQLTYKTPVPIKMSYPLQENNRGAPEQLYMEMNYIKENLTKYDVVVFCTGSNGLGDIRTVKRKMQMLNMFRNLPTLSMDTFDKVKKKPNDYDRFFTAYLWIWDCKNKVSISDQSSMNSGRSSVTYSNTGCK